MTRIAPVVSALFLAASAAPQERSDVPAFPAGVDLVTVDVVVLDSKGEPVRGLVAKDFVLFEDGQPQPIASFEAIDMEAGAREASPESPPIPGATNVGPAPPTAGFFVLLVDDMSLAPARHEVVQTAIARFLTEGVRPGDELLFATTSGDIWWHARIPEGGEDLAALAARVRGRNLSSNANDAISDWEAYRITHLEGSHDPSLQRSRPGGGPPPPTGPPSGPPPPATPGSSATDRVMQRYYQRRVCDPDSPPTPPEQCIAMVHARAQQTDTRRRQTTLDTLAAVDRVIFALTGVRGRKSLLLLTEGFLNDPNIDALHAVAGRCREANIAVYSLDVRGLVAALDGMSAADPGKANTDELGLMRVEQTEFQAAGSVSLAEDTGGFAVRDTNDLGAGAMRVAEESRVYYLIGYTPPEGKGPKDWRRLKVEVGRRGLEVRARKGYTLRTTAEIAAAMEPHQGPERSAGGKATQLPPDVARALVSGRETDAVPLRAMAYALEERPGGTVRTVLAVEADTRGLSNIGGEEKPRTVLSLSILATHRDSGKTFRLDQRVEAEAVGLRDWDGWLALSREFDLPPGVAQARVVIRDELLHRIGALTLRFSVPPPGGLRISTPLLTNRVSPLREGEPSRPVLIAHREFAPAGQLYCQFQVFGAARGGVTAPRVEASYELRRAGGDVIREAAPTPIAPSPDGRLLRLLAVPLEGMPEGDYNLLLRVEDKASGERREQVEPLRIKGRTG
jgi:VWFA-related protein